MKAVLRRVIGPGVDGIKAEYELQSGVTAIGWIPRCDENRPVQEILGQSYTGTVNGTRGQLYFEEVHPLVETAKNSTINPYHREPR